MTNAVVKNKAEEAPVVARASDCACNCEHNHVKGWLAFFQVVFAFSGIGVLWLPFYGVASLAGGVSGTGIAVSIELIFVGLILSVGFLGTAVLIGLRKKLAILWTYLTLGATVLLTALVSITLMTYTYTSNDAYDYYYQGPSAVGLPGGVIVLLVGVIIITLVKSALVALYFYSSERTKNTLTK